MTDTTTDGDEFDLLDAVREDPPRIQEPGQLEAVARFRLGNAVYVAGRHELADGRVVAPLGVALPTDTSEGARGTPEMTFLNYQPVACLVATPTDSGDYHVRAPDRDSLGDALEARERRENDHRATVLPAVRNLLLDAQDVHADVEADSDYARGVHDGMARMADIVLSELMRRWNAPYKGSKRYDAPDDSDGDDGA